MGYWPERADVGRSLIALTMDNFDPLSNFAIGTLLLSCWALVPGLIAGLLLREYGRWFWRGFALGAVCGPIGVVLACALLAADNFRRRRHPIRERTPRAPYYQVPLFGRLHFSTVWSFAGLAVFLCAWTLGVIGYAYVFDAAKNATATRQINLLPRANSGKAADNAVTLGSSPLPDPGNTFAEAIGPDDHNTRLHDRLAAFPAPNAPTRAPLREPFPDAGNASVSLYNAGRTPSSRPENDTSVANQSRAPGASSAPMASPTVPPSATTEATTVAKSTTVRTSNVLSEVMQSFATRGHRVHATLSGEGKAATLAVSCSTLTRTAGDGWLGSSATRQSLRASGVRVVVMLNGRDSWTYIL